MRRIEGILNDWHRLHKELSATRERLAQMRVTKRRDCTELEAEVARMKDKADAALHAVQAALAVQEGTRREGDRPGIRGQDERTHRREGPGRAE